MKNIILICLFITTLGLRAAQPLEMYWIDVEGGAATLIVTPLKQAVLIDAGNPGGRDSKRIVECIKNVAKVEKIDALITTHYHGDHFGGAAEVAAQIPINAVYDNGAFEGQTERPSKPYMLFPAEKRVQINPGDMIPLDAAGGVTIKCLGCRKKFIEPPKGAPAGPDATNAKQKDKDPSDNANSVVTLLSYGDFRFICCGDLTWNIEQNLVCPVNLAGGTVDVYQVTHHGLDISNNPLVLQALKPKVAVMSNGTTKGCAADTWTALRATPSIEAVFQIHKNLRKDSENNAPDEHIANLEQKCEGNFIKLSADAEAKSYTLSIPAKNVAKTFKMQTR